VHITFNIPWAFEGDTSRLVNARALKALLDCQVALNLAYLADHAAPPLYKAGVVYGRTQLWEPIPAVLARGFGDCKSLAPWLVAEYRKKGINADTVFRWIKNNRGGTDFHILVVLPDGTNEDPSKVLGMGKDENRRY
jgi:hypothetical protein